MSQVATPPTVRVTAGLSLRQSGMASLPDITPSITSNNSNNSNSSNSITPLPSLSSSNLSLQPRRENTHHTVVVMNITRTVVIVDINKNNSSSSVKMWVTTKEVEVIKLASQVCTL